MYPPIVYSTSSQNLYIKLARELQRSGLKKLEWRPRDSKVQFCSYILSKHFCFKLYLMPLSLSFDYSIQLQKPEQFMCFHRQSPVSVVTNVKNSRVRRTPPPPRKKANDGVLYNFIYFKIIVLKSIRIFFKFTSCFYF